MPSVFVLIAVIVVVYLAIVYVFPQLPPPLKTIAYIILAVIAIIWIASLAGVRL